jgi:hypothetical protein
MDRTAPESHKIPIRKSLLGEGEFFFHVAIFERLDSIGQKGLTTPRSHGMESTFSITEDLKDNLFLFPREEDAIGHLFWQGMSNPVILLRFERCALGNSKPYHDPNYAKNEQRYGQPLREVYGFSVDATISPSVLEGCAWVKREPGHDKWSSGWLALSKVTRATRKVEKGRLREVSERP